MVKPPRIDGLPTLDQVLVFNFLKEAYFKLYYVTLVPRLCAGQSDTQHTRVIDYRCQWV